MQRSNSYTIIFSLVVCVLIGGALALVNELLKDRIAANKANETRVNIMSAVTVVSASDPKEIEKLYKKNIESYVINNKGERVTEDADGKPVVAEEINVKKQYKAMKDAKKLGQEVDMLLPVFKFRSELDSTQTEAYIFPVYGAGLWDAVWGYVAVSGDFKTVKGVVFDHTGETPGLGARITDKEFQARFAGKGFLNTEKRELYSLDIVKGEGNVFEGDDNIYKVDGLSGASMTTNGVEKMISDYFGFYKAFVMEESLKSGDDEKKGTPSDIDVGNMVSVQ